MSQDYTKNLEVLRDQLVAERRAMVESMLADPASTSEAAAEFGGLQQFIDSVERALSHEAVLTRPKTAMPTRYAQRRPS